jgi:hypothetical protein
MRVTLTESRASSDAGLTKRDHQMPDDCCPQRGNSYIATELQDRIAALRQAAREGGDRLVPPLLMLGTMERVGSNWMSDSLRPLFGQHNEPWRQQLGGHDHPLSALHLSPRGLNEVGGQLGAYARHWLVSFAVGAYGTTRQVIKESNLFFALPGLLDTFRDAPVLVLARSPLGVASSFRRGDLFARWSYRDRYQQMVSITSAARHHAWSALVPDDNPPDLVALTRLHVLNAALLAQAVHERDSVACVSYETGVLQPEAAWRNVSELVPELFGTRRPVVGHLAAGAEPVENTFATSVARTELLAHLHADEADLVRATTAAALDSARPLLPPPVAAQAEHWLSGDHLYTLTPRTNAPRRTHGTPAHSGADIDRKPAYIARAGVTWRNLLVNNAEYAHFLNELAAAGLENQHGGAYLLCCEMPHERGGRLHRDPVAGRWKVSPGFEQHPAYWVTWIGAAAFAARHGARLPARAEMLLASAGAAVSNSDYRVGDTVPVIEPGRGPEEVHHLVGNVQVWCSDGPEGLPEQPLARWLHGAAWNTPASPEEVHRPRHRHLAGSSRGVGIRLVRDAECRPPLPAERVAAALRGWIDGLVERDCPLAALDRHLLTVLHFQSKPDHKPMLAFDPM